MSTYYLVQVLVCVACMFVLMVHMKNNSIFSDESSQWWGLSFISITLVTIAELLGEYLNFKSYTPIMHTMVTLIVFICVPFLPILLSFAVNVKKPVKYMAIIALVHMVLELVFVWFGGIFTMDIDGYFHRGPYYFIYLIFAALSFGYLLYIFYSIKKRFKQKDRELLFGIVIIMLVGFVPTVLSDEYKTFFLGFSLATLFLYFYFERLLWQTRFDMMIQKEK